MIPDGKRVHISHLGSAGRADHHYTGVIRHCCVRFMNGACRQGDACTHSHFINPFVTEVSEHEPVKWTMAMRDSTLNRTPDHRNLTRIRLICPNCEDLDIPGRERGRYAWAEHPEAVHGTIIRDADRAKTLISGQWMGFAVLFPCPTHFEEAQGTSYRDFVAKLEADRATLPARCSRCRTDVRPHEAIQFRTVAQWCAVCVNRYQPVPEMLRAIRGCPLHSPEEGYGCATCVAVHSYLAAPAPTAAAAPVREGASAAALPAEAEPDLSYEWYAQQLPAFFQTTGTQDVEGAWEARWDRAGVLPHTTLPAGSVDPDRDPAAASQDTQAYERNAQPTAGDGADAGSDARASEPVLPAGAAAAPIGAHSGTTSSSWDAASSAEGSVVLGCGLIDGSSECGGDGSAARAPTRSRWPSQALESDTASVSPSMVAHSVVSGLTQEFAVIEEATLLQRQAEAQDEAAHRLRMAGFSAQPSEATLGARERVDAEATTPGVASASGARLPPFTGATLEPVPELTVAPVAIARPPPPPPLPPLATAAPAVPLSPPPASPPPRGPALDALEARLCAAPTHAPSERPADVAIRNWPEPEGELLEARARCMARFHGHVPGLANQDTAHRLVDMMLLLYPIKDVEDAFWMGTMGGAVQLLSRPAQFAVRTLTDAHSRNPRHVLRLWAQLLAYGGHEEVFMPWLDQLSDETVVHLAGAEGRHEWASLRTQWTSISPPQAASAATTTTAAQRTPPEQSPLATPWATSAAAPAHAAPPPPTLALSSGTDEWQVVWQAGVFKDLHGTWCNWFRETGAAIDAWLVLRGHDDPGYAFCSLCQSCGLSGQVNDWASHVASLNHKKCYRKLSSEWRCGDGAPWGHCLGDPRWVQTWQCRRSAAFCRVHFATGLFEEDTF